MLSRDFSLNTIRHYLGTEFTTENTIDRTVYGVIASILQRSARGERLRIISPRYS